MAYLKPQTPLKDKNTGDYIYPLTTVDQVVMPDGSRLNSVFKHTVQKEVTLLASAWSTTEPYTQTVTVDNYVDDLKVFVNVIYSGNIITDRALNKANSCLTYTTKHGKEITFYCLKNKPEIDIPVEISYETINNIANVTVIDGIKLNFSIVGGANQPSNPEENMIWVQTDDEENIVIEHWSFDAQEPVNPIDGMVWFLFGSRSEAEFNALKKNGIQLYPMFASQYIGGVWVNKFAKSYLGDKWVDWWDGTLYDAGDEYTYITGGWERNTNIGIGVSTNTGTITKNATSLYFSAPGAISCVLTTKEKINLTGYKTLSIEGSGRGFYAVHQFTSGLLNKEAPVQGWVTNGSGDIDISTLDNGEYYISLGTFNGSNFTCTNTKLIR